MENGEILIVGGGIGGLSAAIALRGIGREVTVLEIQPDLHSSTYGVGIIQPINALRALDALGCADACLEHGYPSEGWGRMLDLEGNPIREVPGAVIPGSRLPTLNGITRPKLHKILTDRTLESGARIEYGATISELASEADGVAVTLGDGTTRRVGMVVGADGVRSVVRPYVLNVEPTYIGQSAFRVNLPAQPEIDRIILQPGPAGMTGYVPIGPDLAYLFLNITWDRSRRLTQDEQLQLLRELLEPYGGLTARVREKYLHSADDVVFRPEEYLIAPAPWHRGRIVLLGDAVHTVTPHLGQGAAQAIEDAVVLAEELAGKPTPEEAFSAYADRRYERCKFIVDASVAIGEWEMHHTPGFDHAALTQQVVETMVQPL
jgi:2-polyprenyl-6-methoxyphenol hydroxylase-like FAD-dependent oxidoreductase